MTDPILQTTNLTKEFGNLVAVDDVNLNIERGEFRSLIGPNGAGKTTTFNLLTGALRPTRGTVTFNGENVTSLPPHERVRRGLGRSFQITNVFSGLTVRENVRLAAQAAREDGFRPVEEFLQRANTFDDVNEHTDRVLDRSGLLGRGDELADVLAYGDKRRLEIAIVLATDPDMVLLDEPTAGMSAEETRATMDLIDEVLSDRTLLLIEHDIDLVMRVSDRITVLHRGEILAEGSPEAVSEDPEVREAYFGGVEA
ncbi:ABC transporter ATP-binding protein (plasmid) [Haloferax mediterranei ATCC 33500]|uniref:Probable branched-chain amino acid transport ATP-binding protein LivG n=1 Tax=Haloferax mediterranei (strain ATCC 33500 / DSM 1411 / JCM 8866 / NBRC 14739 / NCIMB 2177 / R-4) TaxID=523841 RepID=I3RB79_HALMT|nr:ABC transporter ATP-binding protein [Haloferax mediterranei]AFK21489.1 branched-chain amino acid ABC transporter ATP-binding protein [Haloferax mediterranei ATCC 33500]AHZ24452.1 branched-chain amino acid ABC transporter substrate-binding protein [Haloferax mediterranei ATCC 33500]ELZ97198.1 branched-chain amino acid ABC transporter ATP-binding protein [Haloferax mediterranei ATCC 33500]MDX5990064.1 ABC transporter ATP-binding protein [Haloferax mediterranei ATCC 33500]QCQ76850.1 ABC transp